MTLISKQNQHFLFDRSLKPVLTAKPGDEVTFETYDACCGEVRTAEQFLKRRRTPRASNPMTGPVRIEGAQPGHTLIVEITRIELDPDGYQLIGPYRAIIRDEIPDWTCHAFRVEGRRVIFPNGIEVAADPMIGQFGNAPAGEPTNCVTAVGGNTDCPQVRVGARLYIPVEVEGALFSLGDVHACQGDGEVVGAPEIGARVTVKFGLLKHRHAESYMFEDANDWHTCRTAPTEGEAARLAIFQNADFLCREYSAELRDTLVLLTLIGRLNISRTAKWGTHNPVVCASFSKQQAKDAFRNYRRSSTPGLRESEPSVRFA